MSEQSIIYEFERMLSRKHREIVHQGVLKSHGFNDGKRYWQKIYLTKDHPLSNALMIHKLAELTLHAQAGHDIVHDEIDAHHVHHHHPDPHSIARVLHCRYLLAHARHAGVHATLADMLSHDPISSAHALTTINPELSAYLTSLVHSAPRLASEPYLIAHNPLETPMLPARQNTALAHPTMDDALPRIRTSIEATWQHSRYGNTTIMQHGIITVDHGDERAQEYMRIDHLLDGSNTWILTNPYTPDSHTTLPRLPDD